MAWLDDKRRGYRAVRYRMHVRSVLYMVLYILLLRISLSSVECRVSSVGIISDETGETPKNVFRLFSEWVLLLLGGCKLL